jgi:MoaA/NifB/PqqE/SkfB family radical SAM enzyme
MPSIVAHQIIDGCDVRCRFCDLWTKGRHPREALTLAEIETMLEEGAGIGLRNYVVYGGEPLMRDDIGPILAAAKQRGYKTVMCSSSGRLLERVEQIGPYIDVFLCSIDGSPETHDRMRNAPGLFDRVLTGIRALKKYPCEIRLWTHLHRHNASEVVPIAELAQRLDVAVDFFPTHEAGRGAGKLVLDDAARRTAFDAALAAKARGLPVRTNAETLRSARDDSPFRCTWPSETVYVTPDGNVYPCERVHTDADHLLGNVRDGLAGIVTSAAFARNAAELEACNACRLPCVMEVSLNAPTPLKTS